MKSLGILLVLTGLVFANSALAFNIQNNTNSSIFYLRQGALINPGQNFTPFRQDEKLVLISWAKQDSSGTHWNPKVVAKCPVIVSKNVTLTGNCQNMIVNPDNTVTCKGTPTPTCGSQ